jgi:long-chain fatty acid transport protein
VESRNLIWKTCLSALTFSLYATSANAAGFALIEQGVKGLGNAYAGGAASAEDASTIFYNPAGMTLLNGRQFIVAGHIIMPSAKFSNENSTVFTGTALTGGDGGDGGETAVIPNFYYVQEMPGGYRIGLGINVPFGLATGYDSNWKGRYQAIRSEIRTININPALAFKLGDELSLGFGADLQYIDAKLTSAVDFSAACLLGQIALTIPAGTCAATGLTTVQNPNTEGLSDNTADDSSWGFNLGLLYEFSPATRVGLAYRSKIRHKLKGQGDFTVPAGGATAVLGPTFADTSIIVYATLPENISASVFHQIDAKWAVMGDITQTRWSRIPELRIDFENPLKSDGVEPLNWKNSWRYAVGVTHYYSNRLTWRAGIAYDQTPVPNAESRTSRVPDNNRRWLAFGGSYAGSKKMTVDFGYAHLFVSDAPINRTGALQDKLVGTFKNQVDILSAQVGWNF